MPPFSREAPLPYPEAGTVRVGPNEAETIAGNVLAPHSKCDDGGGVPGQEVLGWGFRAGLARAQDLEPQPRFLPLRPHPIPSTLLSGLISQLSVSLSSWKPAWRRRLRGAGNHVVRPLLATAALGHRCRERTLSRLIEAGRRHTGSLPAPCPGHSPWKGEGLRLTNLSSSRAAA